MDTIVYFVASKLRMPEYTVRAGIKTLLRVVEQNMEHGKFQELVEKIPGAQELLDEPDHEPAGKLADVDVLNEFVGSIRGLITGASGKLVEILKQLQEAGLELTQVQPFVEAFLEKLETEAGHEPVELIRSTLSRWVKF